jgi:hypothetical protein
MDTAYARPMAMFLNKYAGGNRFLKAQDAETLREAFTPTIRLLREAVGTSVFKPKRALNAAVFDSVMVGVARALRQGKALRPNDVGKRYKALLVDPEFSLLTSKATADEENVKSRIRLATRAFAAR